MSLPSILFANARSLEPKMGHMRLGLIVNWKVRNCYVVIATKIWLKHSVPDSVVSLVGFSTFWLDHSLSLSGKSHWGGVFSFYVNDRWCNVNVVSSLCFPDVELLTTKYRPFYLSRECSVILLQLGIFLLVQTEMRLCMFSYQ
uniref:Uncharacterized protein n=1 Tax=Micrurus paraensis TaxID=1970185 RepID=A0A2D4KHC0_9SAUR